MVIDDLHPVRAVFRPDQAEAPLVVDPNAMLPLAIALEGLKPVAGRDPQFVEVNGGVHMRSFLRATCWIWLGSLREPSPVKIRAVSAEAKFRIMAKGSGLQLLSNVITCVPQ
jgi:hypothetical protein